MELKELKNKKIAILGFGIENQSLYNYLVKNGVKNITICDQLSKEAFWEKFPKLKKVSLKSEDDYLKNLEEFDILFRTPGLPISKRELVQASGKGVTVSSAIKLLFDICPAKIIGVTGTKGKGTTSTLIFNLLKAGNKGTKRKIWLAGNIGQSAFDFFDDVKKDDYLVLELSSFQLQDLKKSPHVSVILNITVDHLDYHKTRKEYVSAKESIVRYQTDSDYAVINADYLSSIEFASMTKGQTWYFSRRKWVDQGSYVKKIRGTNSSVVTISDQDEEIELTAAGNLKLRGEHNLENICAAVTVAHILKVPTEIIRKEIIRFPGLEHRLELAGKIDNVEYYNDSFSTNPEPTIAAVSSFSEPVVLICGGRDKGLSYKRMGKKIVRSSVKAMIVIGETTDKIVQAVLEAKQEYGVHRSLKIVRGMKTMEEIVKEAYKIAYPGEVVLLSPAAASQDMFTDYKERGKLFKKAVQELKEK